MMKHLDPEKQRRVNELLNLEKKEPNTSNSE
jgi:hypothetical protein